MRLRGTTAPGSDLLHVLSEVTALMLEMLLVMRVALPRVVSRQRGRLLPPRSVSIDRSCHQKITDNQRLKA